MKMNKQQRTKHLHEDGALKVTWFFRSYSKGSNSYTHGRIGETEIRGVFKYWNARLNLGLPKATSDMARKTFCTLGSNFFHFPDNELMKISHHETLKQFKKYVLEAPWEDLEQDCHIGRTFRVFERHSNLWANDNYQTKEFDDPPVVISVTDVLSRLAIEIKTAMRKLRQDQRRILTQTKNNLRNAVRALRPRRMVITYQN
jgi:hypothetical protein